MKIVECVPNFSEGRRKEVIEAIENAAASIKGVTILDCESDPSHNRMVLTFVGQPDGVKRAALESSAEAIKHINLTSHKGEHPRMGAVDVVPFVPLREVTMQECVDLANEFAEEFSRRFGIPVFLYEYAAKRPERNDLAKVRAGQFEGLRELIGKDPAKDPDYGPKVIHPTAGATAVGARPILIAYNVNLGSTNLSVAKKIAHLVRERDGGLPTVKALGFELKESSLVQVSMNLTDYKVTSMKRAFDEVSKHALELGIPVVESEVVGLVPMDALVDTATKYLKLTKFNASQIIENRLFDIAGKDSRSANFLGEMQATNDFSTMTLADFATAVSSKTPTPGGGTVAAYVGELAASLVIMVCKLTVGKKGYESSLGRLNEILAIAEKSKEKLHELANQDSLAYSKVSKALALPKNTDDERNRRQEALERALKEATEVPANTLYECARIFNLAIEVEKIGNKNAISDAQTAVELARASGMSAWSNVKVNLESLSQDTYFKQMINARVQPCIEQFTKSFQ
jgi:glutamate formiminotransferase/formiminotetrahydrofolate cyclodeaminase